MKKNFLIIGILVFLVLGGSIALAAVLPALQKNSTVVKAKTEAAQTHNVTPVPSSGSFDPAKAKAKFQSVLEVFQANLVKLHQELRTLPALQGLDQQAILTFLQQDLEKVKQIQTEIANANDQDSLQSEANKIRAIMNDVKPQLKKYLGQRLDRHIQDFQQKKEKLLKKARQLLDRLKKSSIDSGNLQEDLQTYITNFNDASTTLSQARVQFQQLQNLTKDEDVATTFRSGLELVHQSRAKLKSLHPSKKK